MNASLLKYEGALCGGCSYCWWALRAMVPVTPSKGSLVEESEKPANTGCQWLCAGGGCSVHETLPEDSMCTRYACAWVLTQIPHLRHHVRMVDGPIYCWNPHRPDSFQQVLAEPWVEMPGIMPLVPDVIPLEKARNLVRQTRMIIAARAQRNPGGMITGGFRVGLLKLANGANGDLGTEVWQQAMYEAGLPQAA